MAYNSGYWEEQERSLRKELAEARAEIDKLNAEIVRLKGVVISQITPEPLVLSRYSTTDEPAKDERDKIEMLEKGLAEARAEIGRLEADANKWRVEAKSKNDARLNLESAAVSIEYWTNQSFQKDKLIEQLKAEIERLNKKK